MNRKELNRVLDRIRNRQLARLLDHMSSRGILTDEVAIAVKRSFNFTFSDVLSEVQELNKDHMTNEAQNSTKTE